MILTLFLQGAKPPLSPQAFGTILVTFHRDYGHPVVVPLTVPPLLFLLRVRIIFLRPPPVIHPLAVELSPPLLVRRCILDPLRFEHRFAIFVLYITKIKKFKLSLKIYLKPIKTCYNPFINSPIHQFIKSSHNS